MAMPIPHVTFVIQLKSESGEWFDFDDHPVKLKAEANFATYKKKMPKSKAIRLIRRTEVPLGIREGDGI